MLVIDNFSSMFNGETRHSVLWFTPAASRIIVSLYTTKLSGQAVKFSIKYGKTYDDDDIHTHTMVTMIV